MSYRLLVRQQRRYYYDYNLDWLFSDAYFYHDEVIYSRLLVLVYSYGNYASPG